MSNLIVVFSGFANGLVGVREAAFRKFVEETGWSLIWLTDNSMMGYLAGDNERDTQDELISFLKDEISKHNHTMFIGSSVGGYAAISLGVQLNVNRVVNFSGPTAFDDETLSRDQRAKRQHEKAKFLTRNNKKLRNLKNILKNNNTPIVHYYPSKFMLDVMHAKNIEGCSNVSFVPVPSGDHLYRDIKFPLGKVVLSHIEACLND